MDSPNKVNRHKWGQSQHLHMTETVDLAFAQGRAGGESSWHIHRHKFNTFLVVTGEVAILHQGPACVHRNSLSPGQSFTVPPRIKHRMIFETDATLYELYTASNGEGIDLADIERFDEGQEPTTTLSPQAIAG